MTDWLTVATFDFIPDAHIALGRLRAEGLPCRLADEHLVQTDWLYSQAVGGIKLCVPSGHAKAAIAILNQDFSAELDHHDEP